MNWNWQQDTWPKFRYDASVLTDLENQFLQQSGILQGALKHVSVDDKMRLAVELMSTEAVNTSEIEGEILNRDSVQSSIRRNFGLDTDSQHIPLAEQGIAEMMVDLYRSYDEPLTHSKLFSWHKMLTKGRRDLTDVGQYRTHEDAMQVVSGPIHDPIVHFEAPPSSKMQKEMHQFIDWFNGCAPGSKNPLSALTRAGIAHLYFVCVHPFEDGNGRVGRAVSEMALSQSLGQPTLLALSYTIQNAKKAYYLNLELNNKELDITNWLQYFSKTVLDAQSHSQQLIDFLIAKTRMYDRLKGQFNARQEKVIARLFREGPKGFDGGLSAENYISITSTSRATATRDLQDLVEKKALVRSGERKHTRYNLNIEK